MGVQKRLMRILTTIDTIWLNEVLPASPKWIGPLRSVFKAVASPTNAQSIFAVQIRFMDIVAKYNGSSEAAHAYIDDDRYDKAD